MFEKNWYEDKSYQESCRVQESIGHVVRSQLSGVVLGFEYPSTAITLGVRSCESLDILQPEALKERGLELITTDRGGQATVHSPGQLVLYPVLPLQAWRIGVRDYIRLLVETTSCWLSSHGIPVENSQEGVFTRDGKIAFVGIAIHKGVSFHGVSINVMNDLSLFSLIRICGASRMDVTSMYPPESKGGPYIQLETFFHQWCHYFSHGLARTFSGRS